MLMTTIIQLYVETIFSQLRCFILYLYYPSFHTKYIKYVNQTTVHMYQMYFFVTPHTEC